MPTDFSDIAEHGLKAAVQIAQKLKAEIFLLNCIPPPSGGNFSATGDVTKRYAGEEDRYVAELRKVNDKKLKEIAHSLGHDVHISTVLRINDLQVAVADFIEAYNIDLVVMGTSGENTFPEYFVGNHLEQVIRISQVPVIAVKQHLNEFKINNIVLATDLNPDAYDGVTHVKKFAAMFDATIHVMHVINGSGASRAEANSKMESFVHRHHLVKYTITVVEHDDEEKGILEFAKEKQADIIAAITHGRTGLASLMFGSVTEDLIREANIPVLTVHRQDED